MTITGTAVVGQHLRDPDPGVNGALRTDCMVAQGPVSSHLSDRRSEPDHPASGRPRQQFPELQTSNKSSNAAALSPRLSVS